ncbi:IS1182 family transposase [Streptomyces sp. NBC_01242]|uniref:IS1182 family transposase n=1 Tax=unclassified Streptomyces TaxID=2593676 RepID=UPI0022567C6B|nr:IS1182 family transposase [Streptomyces sp. NBC_01242]MCX4793468.1 IS1182 family transposase [Streptomyces sp. NBC_01242]WSU20415.1 IS1182 family transposase [Streptomyces sp. NBC_01108]WSU26008.1 IS1182 family transposase [Streptomyces sp. NBC_01108]
MSLEPRADHGVPELTARVVRAAFPKGTMAVRIREALGPLFEDEAFAEAFAVRGRPAVSPGALALVSVLQYAEGLTDRQAADQVRARMDWKFLLGLELDDPGFEASVLSLFRSRLIEHGLEQTTLELVLERLRGLDLLKAGGRQRTDSTHVLAAVRTLNRMEFVGETLRAALEALAVAAPAWLSGLVTPEWAERYGPRVDAYRFPKGEEVREQWSEQVGRDGFVLLDAVYAPAAPDWLREIEAVQVLRVSWVQQYHRDEKGVRWREGKDLPPVHHRLCSPYDTDARYGIKRGSGWTGYKAHLTETCEPDAPHVITQVATTDAVVADTEMTEPVHQTLAERELLPHVHVVDAGYTTAALFLSATERGMELLGPAPHDSSRQSREDQGFSRADFTIDWDNESATCPGGHQSFEWWEQKHHRNGTPVLKVFFSAEHCRPCPKQTACTKPPSGRRGRGITFLPRERHEALEAVRQAQETDN